MSDESEYAIEQAELSAWDQAKQWHEEQALTFETVTKQALEQHERIRLLEEWMCETIRAWKTGDIKTAHIQRGQWLLEG